MANTLFGNNVTYEDVISQEMWASLHPDIQKFLIEQGAIPVASQHMFPTSVSMLSTAEKTNEQARADYAKYGLNPKDIKNEGNMLYRTPSFTAEVLDLGQPIEKARTVLATTDKSGEAATIEEYLHYLDSVMGDTSTIDDDPFKYSESLSEIMYDLIQEDSSLSKEELLEKFMNDSRTAHLDFENPNDPRAGIVTGGRNNPRKKIGRYLANALTDNSFKDWALNDPIGIGTKYLLKPTETFAGFTRPDIKYTEDDEWFEKETSRPYNLPESLSRDLAHSISSYLNKMQWDKEHQDLWGTEHDPFMIKNLPLRE